MGTSTKPYVARHKLKVRTCPGGHKRSCYFWGGHLRPAVQKVGNGRFYPTGRLQENYYRLMNEWPVVCVVGSCPLVLSVVLVLGFVLVVFFTEGVLL